MESFEVAKLSKKRSFRNKPKGVKGIKNGDFTVYKRVDTMSRLFLVKLAQKAADLSV